MSHRETNFPQIAQVLVLEHWRQWRFIRPHPNLVYIPFLIWRYEDTKRTTKIYESTWRLEKKRRCLESKSFSSGWWEPSPFKKFGAVAFSGNFPQFRPMHLFPLFFGTWTWPQTWIWRGLMGWWLINGLKYLMVSGSKTWQKMEKIFPNK